MTPLELKLIESLREIANQLCGECAACEVGGLLTELGIKPPPTKIGMRDLDAENAKMEGICPECRQKLSE